MKKLLAILLILIPLFFAEGQGWGDADVAYMLYDIDSSRVVVDNRAEIKMTPASVLKLVTTASSLEMLGADSRITTNVTTNGTVDSNGVLNGNIYVKGALDPTVESAFFDDVRFFRPLIDTLRSRQIKSVNGDIVVDGSIIRREAVSDKWVLEDLATYYGVGCYGISVYDNVRNVSMRSSGVGQGVSFSFQYPECSPHVIDRLEVVNGPTNGIHFYALPYGNEILVDGVMGSHSSWGEPLAITNPVMFFAQHLKKRLQDAGISVSGSPREGKASGDNLLYSHMSPMLFHIVRETNYKSNNHFAQHLFRLLGAKGTGGRTATADAVMTISNLWKNRGIDLSSASLYDGNGLSPFDAVTPRQIVDILNYMWHSDNGYYFFHSLPQCGRDGTVATLFVNSPLYVRAKSGSMSGVQSYAGYIVSKGRCYSFCFFVNEFSCTRQQVKNLIEQTITSEVCNYEDTF